MTATERASIRVRRPAEGKRAELSIWMHEIPPKAGAARPDDCPRQGHCAPRARVYTRKGSAAPPRPSAQGQVPAAEINALLSAWRRQTKAACWRERPTRHWVASSRSSHQPAVPSASLLKRLLHTLRLVGAGAMTTARAARWAPTSSPRSAATLRSNSPMAGPVIGRFGIFIALIKDHADTQFDPDQHVYAPTQYAQSINRWMRT